MRIFAFVIHLFAFFLLINEEAKSAEQDTCKTFRIVFDGKVKNIPPFVYANGEKIGKIERSKEANVPSQEVTVCIDSKYTGKFEKNSICYISNEQIVAYNLWSTGIDLKENESVRGFTSRVSAYIYSAKELPTILKDAIMALISEYTGKGIVGDLLPKAKDAYSIISK